MKRSSVLYLTQKDLNALGKNKSLTEITLTDMAGSIRPAQLADLVIYANGNYINVLKNRYGEPLIERVL